MKMFAFQRKWLGKIKAFRRGHNVTYSILIGLAIILFWRGIWNLLDMYLFPNNHLLSNLICVIAGVVMLYFDDFELEELEG